MQDDLKVDQRNIVTKMSSLSVHEENLATIESDVTVDPRYNATEKSETNTDQLFVTTDSQTDLNLMSLEEIMKELNCLRKENKELRGKLHEYEEKIKLLNDELSKSAVFDIDKHKNNPEDITFYTGFPDYEVLLLCYNLEKDTAKNISYSHERIYCDLDAKNQPGRRRALSTFQEFIMVMMRLRLGQFEKDLGHRFNVPVMTVSRITRS